MFTDLAGYTAMMQQDEVNAKVIRDKHREILEHQIAAHEGKILQYYGDGALSIFNSTISASNSAISIQKASIANKIPLRIGIHTGDIVIEEDGVFGDGVNIASRIESFAVPGSVMVSDKVYDDIKNHQTFRPTLMGEFELKNVKKPIEVYALNHDGLVVPHRTALKGKVKERIKSIVVLPFINRSSDPENEHFSDGLTEDLISLLSKQSGLQVVSRSSAFSYKGKEMDVRQLGKVLDVQSVLDGSVRKSGNRVRVITQLSSTLDGYQLWTNTYDRMMEDVFDLQDELTELIVDQLKTNVLGKDQEKKEHNQQAYECYQQGMYYYNKWTPEYAEKSIAYFEHALKLQPDFDLAYSGLAVAYSLMSTTGYIDPAKGYKLLDQYAEKALSINPNSELAYVAKCYVEFFLTWDFEKAHEYTSKALQINPRSADTNLAHSLYYIIQNNFDEAIRLIERARDADPLSALALRTLADAYYFTEDYTTAINLYDNLLELDPDFKAATEFKGWCYLMMGEFDKAIAIFKNIQGNATHVIKPFVQLGYTYALMGEHKQAMSYLNQLQEVAQKDASKDYSLDFATLHTGLGMYDEAFDDLHQVLKMKYGAATLLKVSPIWKPLRSDHRFTEILNKMGLNS